MQRSKLYSRPTCVLAAGLLAILYASPLACGAYPTARETGAKARKNAPIVGGSLYDALPAVGALFVDGQPWCTGTLITRRTVLTAAHCVVDLAPGRMRFRLGANAWEPTKTIEVTRLTPHPAFDPDALTSDIALVTLRSNAPAAGLPPLPHMDESWLDTPLLFVGYGTSGRGMGAGEKRAVWIPIAELDATRFAYSVAGKNTCHGDSGGPAFFHDTDSDTYYIAGITSWGDAGCKYFGVDTRVDAFWDFVAR